MTVLSWLPEATDFRSRLKSALALPDSQRLEALLPLAQSRLGLIETVQLDRALRTVGSGPGFVPLRLIVLASATVDHLLPAIRVAGLRRRLLLEIRQAGYGQYRQELLDSRSRLHAFKPHFVLFALSARDFIATTPINATEVQAGETLTAAVTELKELWIGPVVSAPWSFSRLFSTSPSPYLEASIAWCQRAPRNSRSG